MKAQELRIGNYINVTIDENYQNILLAEVCSLDTEDIKEVRIIDDHNIDDQIFDVMNIPITEEWLKLFGFEDLRPSFMNFRKNDFYIGHSKDLKEEFRRNHDGYYYNDNGSLRTLNYVHQLQNLYHALTGEELTIKNE